MTQDSVCELVPRALPPAMRTALLDLAAWQDGLYRFSLATNLAAALVDAEGRMLILRNPQPLWSLFRRQKEAKEGECPFALAPVRPCTCVAKALETGRWAMAGDRTGLVHFAVPLVLGEDRLGALLAGQVFTQFPEQLAVERVAQQFGLPAGRAWHQARLEPLVKQATLEVYADLLAFLGQTFLHTQYHSLMENDRLAEMTRLRDQAVVEMAERKRAEEALQEADRRKNEFLAMLAHELRNPLAPILNALQILRLARGSDETRQSASEVIERQVGHMVHLVDDLLDVSRISRGHLELRRGRIELASAVNHALETARSLQCMDHELTVALPPQPIYLNADPSRLAQIVGNLLHNACKFTDKGGRIWLTVEREGGQAVLRVRDTGIGIAADQLSRIFGMFVQVDTSLERSVNGLGVGLSLVKNLVELHGGTVEVHSAGIGHGSEFVVRLPVLNEEGGRREAEKDDEESAADSFFRLPPSALSKRRVLVVDDNRDAASSLAALLEMTGNETHVAHDGLAAVQAAAVLRPDVVLLDIGLPKLNGYEAARKIRQTPWGKGAVLVALTGWGQEEDRQMSREAGFDGHMVKPVDHADLMELLDGLQGAKQ